MAQIVAVNAFLRGTGATFLAANLAASLSKNGARVGLVDADLSAPTLHYLLGIDPTDVEATLNDYLLGLAALDRATQDVTGRLKTAPEGGRLFCVPATEDIQQTTTTLLSTYDLDLLSRGFRTLSERYDLDWLVVDTPAGTAKETLLTLALCDHLLVITTLDPREIKGSTIAVDLARELSVAKVTAILNKSGVSHDADRLRAQMQTAFDCDAAAVIPYSDAVATLASSGLFVVEHPDHPVTAILYEILNEISQAIDNNDQL